VREDSGAAALRPKLDRRERILDLVREASRAPRPSRVALRLQQRRDVVEHDRRSRPRVVVAGQRGARSSSGRALPVAPAGTTCSRQSVSPDFEPSAQ
jgi:hypothetical protein